MSINLNDPKMDAPENGLKAEVAPTSNDTLERLRQQAIKRIKQRRTFHVELVVSGIGMMILVLIWATSEYHGSGGWPTQGFSQSSGSMTCGTTGSFTRSRRGSSSWLVVHGQFTDAEG
jgi:hypothetical protein